MDFKKSFILIHRHIILFTNKCEML